MGMLILGHIRQLPVFVMGMRPGIEGAIVGITQLVLGNGGEYVSLGSGLLLVIPAGIPSIRLLQQGDQALVAGRIHEFAAGDVYFVVVQIVVVQNIDVGVDLAAHDVQSAIWATTQILIKHRGPNRQGAGRQHGAFASLNGQRCIHAARNGNGATRHIQCVAVQIQGKVFISRQVFSTRHILHQLQSAIM